MLERVELAVSWGILVEILYLGPHLYLDSASATLCSELEILFGSHFKTSYLGLENTSYEDAPFYDLYDAS